jgi:ArsR family transcriptional regulator
MDIIKSLKVLTDPARLRILRLLSKDELSVADLQEILGMGQSRISMQLSQLRMAGFVDVRRSRQKSLYRAITPHQFEGLLSEILERSVAEIGEARLDDDALSLVLEQRKDTLRGYFDELAGKFGRNYVAGRSWRALTEMLMRLLPPLDIADIGAGEGTLSLMLAQSAKHIYAIDSSQKMMEFGREIASKNGVTNLEYKLGDMEKLPLDDASVDMALMHQTLHHALHPAKAVSEAFRILRTGGRMVVLDLLRHDFEAARERYGDIWLGFSRAELNEFLQRAGFEGVDISVVDRETEPPNFEIVLAMGVKR